MNRRTFLKQIGGMLLLTACSPVDNAKKVLGANGGARRIVILHTNDVHSHIEPFPANDANYAGLGGYARRKAYIDSVRAEGCEPLVFESGDIFQGTPYYNFFDGHVEIDLMNRMGIDAVTIGNHEFDKGVPFLCDRMAEANFPFINSNYEWQDERAKEIVKPYKIFERQGVKVGVFGIGVKIEGLISRENAGGTIYHEAKEVAQRMADQLRAEGCQFVIALTHIGLSENNSDVDDIRLARGTRGIDLILGGHSHTFMPAPIFETNLDGRPVLINQVGYGGVNVGRIEVEVLPESGRVAFVGSEVRTMC